MALLQRYFEGEIFEGDDESPDENVSTETNGLHPEPSHDLLSETLKPRSSLPPLLVNLSEKKPERLHYIGTSFGLTQHLFSFWSKAGFKPVYLRQTSSEVTGEYSLLMMKAFASSEVENANWLGPFVADFKQRFVTLLNGPFREMDLALSLSVLGPQLIFSEVESQAGIKDGVTVNGTNGLPLTAYDLERLRSYANKMVDHHMIYDLVPLLARSYFSGCLPASISYAQAAILLCLGLQQRTVSDVEEALKLPSSQILALFSKLIKKLHSYLRAAKAETILRALPKPESSKMEVQVMIESKPISVGEQAIPELMGDRVNKFSVASVAEVEDGRMLKSGELVSLKRAADEPQAENALPAPKQGTRRKGKKEESKRRKH